MSDQQLSTLLRRHVATDEPGFPGPEAVLGMGRRQVRRRRLAAGAAGAAAAALVGVVGVVVVPDGPSGEGAAAVDPAVARALADYDAQAMPDVLERVAGDRLRARVEGLGAGRFAAYDGAANPLEPADYDKASALSMHWGDRATTELRVELDHARSETEGDHARTCAADLRADAYLVCEVETLANGDVLVHRVGALRPVGGPDAGWYLGTPDGMVLSDPATWPRPRDLWLTSEVEVVKSDSFRTLVSETVHATTVTDPDVFAVPVADLRAIAADPWLVMPEPPTDPSGCGAWRLPGSDSGPVCD